MVSESGKSDREIAILNRVRSSSKLSTEAGKRFLADTRGALRRVKDGPGTIIVGVDTRNQTDGD